MNSAGEPMLRSPRRDLADGARSASRPRGEVTRCSRSLEAEALNKHITEEGRRGRRPDCPFVRCGNARSVRPAISWLPWIAILTHLLRAEHWVMKITSIDLIVADFLE